MYLIFSLNKKVKTPDIHLCLLYGKTYFCARFLEE